MKFLGLRIDDHDSNITYTDGKTVKYCATERLFGIKHHGYDNIWQWSDVLDSWGVKLSDIDDVNMAKDCSMDTTKLKRLLNDSTI